MQYRSNLGRTMSVAAVAAITTVLMAAGPTQAEEYPSGWQAGDGEVSQGTNSGSVSFSLGVDFTTNYLFRGINQEDSGFIAQPWFEATFELCEGGDLIKDISLTAGIWNSFHENHTFATPNGTGPDSWYESDIYAGLNFGIGDQWAGGIQYVSYTSPNDAFDTIQEIIFSLAFDDGSCWAQHDNLPAGFEGLQPYIVIGVEVQNTAFGPDEGVYLELGIEPSFLLIDNADHPVTLSIPLAVGLGISDYYETATDDDDFGFVDLGFVFGVPIGCIPDDYGQWGLSAGVHVFFLGDNTELANNGDDVQIVGTVGITMDY